MKSVLAIVLIFLYLLLLPLVLSGCASTLVTAPSTKPLQEDLGRAQTHITQAKTLAQRIHDKDVLIDRWRATHGQ